MKSKRLRSPSALVEQPEEERVSSTVKFAPLPHGAVPAPTLGSRSQRLQQKETTMIYLPSER
jgi:hypothetical protein